MKERIQPDGSEYYGNGVWGPSTVDRNRANLPPESRKIKEERKTVEQSVLPEVIIGKLLQLISKSRLPVKYAIPGSLSAALLLSACSGNNGGSGKELEDNRESGYSLPFPEGETWYLTQGPHGDGYSSGINYAIDIAPPEGGFCPSDGKRFTIDNRVVTASSSGKVIAKGSDKNRNDSFHSEIRIEDSNGLTLVYVHLDNTKVKLGSKVKKGYPLGNPSCEFPPGGSNSGPHVHIGLMKDGQAILIDGATIGGWTIHEGENSQEGTMTKDGEKTRTADAGRYGENSNGIRNDLPNISNKNKAVVAGPKYSPPPISGQITSKEVENPSIKDLEKNGWRHISSKEYPFEIMAPPEWKVFFDEESSILRYEQESYHETLIAISSDPLESGTTFESYIKNRIRTGTGVDRNGNSNGDAVRGTNANVDKSLFPLLDLRIAGQETALIYDPRDIDAEEMKVQVDFIGNDRTWTIWLTIPSTSKEQVPIIKQILSSFKFKDKSSIKTAEAKKPTPIVEKQIENKISISKKPDELFRVLLTNSISPNVLPQGMTSRGISAGEIDATGKALKQVGAVNIKIEDSVSTTLGMPNGGIFYGIFPDASGAKSVSELIGTHLGNGQVVKDFPYPTKIYTIENNMGFVYTATIVLVTSVENVTVATSLTGNAKSPNADLVQLVESRAISLAQAAIEHLGKVGK